ncbi:DUF427 domain-containing protein [Patulibacter minatonensis]|uniref:DUF427 domain-containing protein n=1 Tax=Patulibacter minatonensis TaxID=298163 RepID=UPI00047A2482|nr:DUF427 domain-containing protein [Patulibacter minatonensis]
MSTYPQPITPVDHVEPVPRRIRATLAGRTVLDTIRAQYLWEWPFYPQFQIPMEDIDPDVLVDEEHEHRVKRGTVARYGLRVGDEHRPGAVRRYLESTVPGIAGTARLHWDALDAWFEEDEQVFVHPRNPYVRVDALRSTRHVRVELDGVLLAESTAPVLVFETGLPTRYYLDRSAVDLSRLVPTDTVTPCPYKGRTSSWWSVDTGSEVHRDLAWSYDFPTRQLLPISGLIAFYDEQVDVTVDGVAQERPVTHFRS